ncbi:unnamed protein product [Urochloa decumbens]|uniref:Uncharacterized protein n=1 Tax=Urochloa decumbens TaxID=240449 RepID=A0ABC9BM67_9POAL
MAAALVGVSTGVMKPLLSKLSKLLEEEYVKLQGVHKQINFLRDELSAMSPTLHMLADSEELNPQMKDWRDKLCELAYDIEDCVDSFMARVEYDGPKGFKGIFHRLKKLKVCHRIANEIEELKKRTMVASERQKRYDFVRSPSTFSTATIDPRLPALYEDVHNLVGINRPKDNVIEWFNKAKGDGNLKVLSIVGSGGLGKTTLANQVYCQLKGQFECTVFVSISRNPCINKILRQILVELGIGDDMLNDERHLIDKIRDNLKDKRYLVVVDDVWDVEAWKSIRLSLFNNRCDSRIIVTTRNVAVASWCSSDGGYVYQMEALSFSDSLRLFCKRAFGSEELCYPHLKEVCYGILDKCGGLPLAIITLSSLLADNLAEDEWWRVLTTIGREFAKNPDAGNMTSILSLSYFDLPHYLRTCFLYLSVFPEDYRIGKQRLINRWIAEGFIYDEQGRSAYEIGERYFNDLANRSLIQPVDITYGEAQACRVHDIILDFITGKATEENFVTTSLDAAEHGKISDYRVRRLLVDARNENNVTIPSSLMISKARSLTIYGYPLQTSLLAFRALHVLDLGDCWGLKDHHLANIEKLSNLRYLCLGSKAITELPWKIGDLQYLETLDLRGTMIKQLPSTVTKLQQLARLYVDSSIRFPDGMIGQMKSLKELAEFEVYSYNVGKSLHEFSQLVHLKTLVICWNFYCSFDLEGRKRVQDLQRCVGSLITTCKLHHLDIHDCHDDFPWYRPLSMDSWCPTARCSLQKLHVTFCFIDRVQIWMSSLGNLKELELSVYCIGKEDLEILGAIPSLVSLELVTLCGTNGRIVFSGNNGFRNLKYFSLYIMSCGTATKFEAGSMPKIEHLKLKFCVHKMECLNGGSNFGIQHLSTLMKVEVVIRGDCVLDIYDNDIVESVARAIKAAVETFNNRPTIVFETEDDDNYCIHFKSRLERINKKFGVPIEWLEKCQIQVTAGEREREN